MIIMMMMMMMSDRPTLNNGQNLWTIDPSKLDAHAPDPRYWTPGWLVPVKRPHIHECSDPYACCIHDPSELVEADNER